MYDWDEKPDLNITPFVDVMLVLMAILMITAPTVNYQEKINLPQGTKSKKVQKESTVTIRMDAKRNIYLGKEHYTLSNFRDTFMLKSKKYDLTTTVFIRADERLPYRDVIFLLKSVKDVGFNKVSLITE